MGLVWTGNVLPMRDVPETADTVYNIPADGTLFWLDTWVHLQRGAARRRRVCLPELHPRPGGPGQGDELNCYASPNDEAKKFIDPKILPDPAVYVAGRRHRQARGRQGPVARPHPDRDLGGVQVQDRRLTPRAIDLDERDRMAAVARAPSGLVRPSVRQPLRNGSLTALLLLPAGLWYLVLLVAAAADRRRLQLRRQRARTAATPGASRSTTTPRRSRGSEPFVTSFWLAIAGTIAVPPRGLPLAYFIATRGGAPARAADHPARHPVLDELPHPDLLPGSSILGPDRASPAGSSGSPATPGSASSAPRSRSSSALVYGYLPLMVFPLYVTLERMDRTLIEASKDLGADRWATFRQITLPIALPGLITGSILVFIPMMGEYVIPAILGYGQIVPDRATRSSLDFLEARNWPVGSATRGRSSSSSCSSRSRSTCGSLNRGRQDP